MKFKYAKIPEISGLKNLDSLLSDKKTYISFIKQGIPFVITDGDIFDQHGNSFPNDHFKKDFSELLFKAKTSRMTILGRICYQSTTSNSNYGINKLRVLFNSNGDYNAIKSAVILELGELIFDINRAMPYANRYLTLNSFGKHVGLTNARIKVHHSFEVDALTEENSKRFAKYSISAGAPMVIRQEDSKYIQDSSDFKLLNTVIFNPFEIKTLKVSNIIGYDRQLADKSIEYVLKELEVAYKGKSTVITASGLKQSRIDYIRESKYRPNKLYMDFLVADDNDTIQKIKFT